MEWLKDQIAEILIMVGTVVLVGFAVKMLGLDLNRTLAITSICMSISTRRSMIKRSA